MSSFSQAINAGLGTLQGVAGEAVTYTRAGSSVSLTAVPAGRTRANLDGGGYDLVHDSRDWIVRTSDLVLDAAAILPQRGDTITSPTSGTFEVSDAAGGSCYTLPGDGSRVRIHTKRIG